MQYCVYVILCDNNSFYTGYTKNLDRRIRLHKNGRGARYTRIHKPKKLVYVEKFDSRREAMQREKKVKRLNHQQKLELIKTKSKLTRQKRRGNQA
ncbi:MAG TPA: GIY-YIG nuclease family protein [Candidatus Bathyarchaeia archaeon]|nr:GIY-YIG nuclease family protein [Candidatus Bathyarchaeia archaeon]